MLYTGDFGMLHYVGFSQIGSHMLLAPFNLSLQSAQFCFITGIYNLIFVCSMRSMYIPVWKFLVVTTLFHTRMLQG